jgi:hypothetical protein
MLRHILISAGLMTIALFAQAGEAGKIVFVAGAAHNGQEQVQVGQSVQEGHELTTGADGYLYLKTIDNGFLILRPNSRAKVVAYHVDAQNPENTRIKLELLNGVARSISGEGVKQARKNFRFNTPVAAIGVRGTDFTVFTDQSTSRVAVVSGGVVVSGFAGGCSPDGGGPCESSASRELFANQAGELLQISKGQATPQMLRSFGLSPDLVAPPRPDEPETKTSNSGKAGSVGINRPTLLANGMPLDPQKGTLLQQNIAGAVMPQTPITPPAPPTLPAVPEVPKQIIWGRWQAVLDKPATIDMAQLMAAKAKLIDFNDQFALFRAPNTSWVTPDQGSVSFGLKQSEAYVLDRTTNALTAAGIENGKLQVDFANSTFATSFDLVSNAERFKMQALGDVGKDGQLYGANQFARPTNMTVSGMLSPENGGSAAYLFQGILDQRRLATGATYWSK